MEGTNTPKNNTARDTSKPVRTFARTNLLEISEGCPSATPVENEGYGEAGFNPDVVEGTRSEPYYTDDAEVCVLFESRAFPGEEEAPMPQRIFSEPNLGQSTRMGAMKESASMPELGKCDDSALAKGAKHQPKKRL